jgi:beta-lactam-binding protein with PASTA domain
VDPSVTTPAGTSPVVAADTFVYVACVGPKLKGKTLKAAKKKLQKAECKLGKVKGKNSKKAKVKEQKPKPGRSFRRAPKSS